MNTLGHSAKSTLPVRAEKFAKADLRKPDTAEYKQKIGATVERARTLRAWTLDELSGKVQRDPRQVARWIKGDERTPFDLLFAIDDGRWRNALVIAVAELGTGVEIGVEIRLPLKVSA